MGVGHPVGTVTFLFTDIVRSTARWEEDPTAMAAALATHDQLLRSIAVQHDGEVFKHTGDWVCVVFASAQHAVEAAISAQAALELPVRMGLHTGFVETRDADFFGPVLNRTARIMATGHGGQILLSAATAALVDGVEMTDLGEQRLRDLTTPEHFFQIGSRDFPPLATVSSFRTNVREPLSSFIGRERELAALGELLAEHRIVTLTGAGGSGKTRLALRAAMTHRTLFPDGIWVLELAALADAAAIPAALCSVLEVVTQPGQAAVDRVIEFLSDRRALLIVDNCEHVLDAAAGLVQRLLGECPHLVALATSREILLVAGEQAFAVSTMSDVTAGMSDGVRLFVDRVREERPGFELTDGNRASVDTICARLDDLPLAVELAAARAAAMGTSDIASRLDERFRLLTAGQRSRVERHRTLRATVEWSYALLETDERAVFEVLSVFAGTFDLDGVLAVSAVDGFNQYQVIDALGSLAAKSMVVVDEHPTLGIRYRLLETLRAFGLERLDASDRLERARSRHADHYCHVAHDAGIELWQAESARSGQRLLADAADHRAAHMWLMADARTDDALAHATSLLNTSVWRGWREPVEWLRAAVAIPAAEASRYRPPALAALAYYTAEVEYDLAHADRLARESIATRQDEPLVDEPVTIGAEITMWFSGLVRGDLDDAVGWGATLMDRSRRRQDIGNLCWGLGFQALAWSYLGRYDEARKTAEEIGRYVGPDPDPLPAWTLHFALGTAWAQVDPQRAVWHFEYATNEAMAGGLPMMGHICQRDALAVNIGHLPLSLAATTARGVIAGMWEDRDVFNIRIAVAHTLVVCASAARYQEGALIDGWLGSDIVPMHPHYAARVERARHDIDVNLGEQGATLRSRGAALPRAAIVEHLLTTLTSIAEGGDTPQRMRVSLPVQ